MNCPKCGNPSEVISGVYDGTITGLNILVDPSISREALIALRNLAEQLQRGEISVSEAKNQAHLISPKATKLFDIENWTDQAKATLYASIIAAIGVVIAARLSSPSCSDMNDNFAISIETTVNVNVKDDLRSSVSDKPFQSIPVPRPKPNHE